MERSVYTFSKDELALVNEAILVEIDSVVSNINNPMLLLLQTHLYVEHLIERLIISELPKGKGLIDKARLTFKQKVLVASSFDVIEADIISGVLKLNVVRNNLAHKFQHSVKYEDIEAIGFCLGPIYKDIQEESGKCLIQEFNRISRYLLGCIATCTHLSENSSGKNS